MAEAPRFAIREIALFERPVALRLPFRFGVVTLTECPQAFVRARIEFADGRTAWGAAAELMAPKWFDKNLALSNEDNFNQLRRVTSLAREAYLGDGSTATAFGHFARHHDAHLRTCGALGFNPLLAAYGPALVDRAVLDALCRALDISFYEAMHGNAAGVGPARPEFAGLDFDAFLAGLTPAPTIEARHTVGMVDAITAADLKTPVADGLPETLEQVVQRYGHRYFKLKVGGKIDEDVARLSAIAAVLDQAAAPYFASLDGNEQYTDAHGIAELMARIRETPSLARLQQSILFVEQPIARKSALSIDLRGAAIGKPVIVDESDGELDSFVQARARGYAGVSSKTCKGFYKSLLNAARCAAWNAQRTDLRYFMSAEDLTTQAGLAVQQDLALVDLLGITHVERNGHHYVDGMAALPAAEQQAFLDAHGDLYERSHGAVRLRIRDGRISLGSLDCAGFASAAMPDFDAMTPMAG
ncbi:enolase C-terminal domain-like protein [Variovorax sp. KK3]|uniref:enolase C-terminal domain-like protein n=1 Tax=Variovorax sp. KK3 TaxID=1855728 RepID=UPI00097BE156|nr:enolase C-terminal domain-like protein [Variovorax sp. KK3]